MAHEGNAQPLLYGYWRSSSSYRVRIALNLKGIAYRQQAVHLVQDGGQQNLPAYRAVNPLGLVPALVHGDRAIVQSVAICEYLEEVFPQPPLLPPDASGRARVRAIVQTIASEIQPLNNLGVLRHLEQDMGQPDAAVRRWYAHWIERGFAALETWLGETASGDFCHGERPTLADCFLVRRSTTPSASTATCRPGPASRASPPIVVPSPPSARRSRNSSPMRPRRNECGQGA